MSPDQGKLGSDVGLRQASLGLCFEDRLLGLPLPRCQVLVSQAAIIGLVLLAFSGAAFAADADGNLQKFQRMLEKGHGKLRCCTAEVLERLGLAPADVIPVVSETFTSPHASKKERETAVAIARWLGEAGMAAPLTPVLVRAFHDKDTGVANTASQALRQLGEAAAPALPELMKRLTEKPGKTLEVMTEIGEAALPYVLECLKSEYVVVRMVSAQALDAFGDHEEILEPLKAVLNDPDPNVRISAVLSAGELPHMPPELVDAVRDRLRDTDFGVVLYALRALERTDSEPAVRELLRHESESIRIIAAAALSRMARIAAARDAGRAPALGLPFYVAEVAYVSLHQPEVSVTFYSHESAYSLKPDHPEFKLYLRRLKAGLADGRKILFVPGFDLRRVLIAPRPGRKEAKESGLEHCLLVADDLTVTGSGCNVVESRTLAVAVERYLAGDPFPEADLAGALADGRLFFWSLEERRSFNAAFVKLAADAGGEIPRALWVGLAHSSLAVELSRALERLPETHPGTAAPEDRLLRSRLSAALQVVRDEVRTHTDE